MTTERIPVAGPSITEREIAYVTDAAKTGWYSTANVYIEKFERAFAAYCGVDYAMALPSCTSAIHLALLAANIGPPTTIHRSRKADLDRQRSAGELRRRNTDLRRRR